MLLPETGRSVLPLLRQPPRQLTKTQHHSSHRCSHPEPPPRTTAATGGRREPARSRGKVGSATAVGYHATPWASCLPLRYCAALVLLQAQASQRGRLPSSVHHAAHHASPLRQRQTEDKGAARQNLLHQQPPSREQSKVEVQECVTHLSLSTWTPRG